MNKKLLTLCFIALAVPIAAQAQNVLVPNSSTSAPSKPAPAPQKAAPVETPKTTTVPSYSLNDALAASPTVQQTAQHSAMSDQAQNIMNTTYASPTQVAALVQVEQKNISMLQMAAAQAQQANAATAMNQNNSNQMYKAGTPNSNAQQAFLASMQQSNAQNLNNINAQLARAQYRLKILQAGPIKLADLAQLYQSQ